MAVNKNDILTNSFFVEYDEEHRHLCVYTVNSGVKSDVPIRLRMDALLEKGKDHAAQWFGESIFLLVPSLRRELYGLDGEASA